VTRLLSSTDTRLPLPRVDGHFIERIQQAGLVGCGGAGFPTAIKWRAVAERSRGNAVIVVNGAEGEPRSQKDRLLMTTRPHLILDGAFIAARVLKARRVVLYIGERHEQARQTMLRALDQRDEPERGMVTFAAAPARYVAGAETAAIHFLNEGIATPTTTPPFPFERGVEGAPTLIQNVETLARVALIARGTPASTALVTLVGAVRQPGVLEVPLGTTLGDAVGLGGGATESPRAVLLGGYFGTWIQPGLAWPAVMDHSSRLGCGVIGVLPASACPVCETAGIMRYLASESSAQCGPCFFGLRALADACTRIAQRGSDPDDMRRLHRWATEVRGRGACRHPDGAVMFLASALEVFGHEFATHTTHRAREIRRSA
jgi:NADH:ubiquinone oxidoreductase subunit F (NADH-binding)